MNSLTIIPVSFSTFAEAVSKPSSLNPRTHVFRTRVVLQVRMDGKALDYNEIGNLAPDVGKQITDALGKDTEVPGKVIAEGDGISTPIMFRLGMPLKAKGSKSGDVEVHELEFMATTFADIEDAICSETPLEQALSIIRTCASAPETKLPSPLPMMMTDQITLADGLAILESVVPVFLTAESD